MQIHSEVCVQFLQKAANRQTNNDENIIILAEIIAIALQSGSALPVIAAGSASSAIS